MDWCYISGGITGLRWFKNERHENKAGARQCLARKAILELMVMYQFRVIDVNYNLVLAASLTARLERESFLALRERVYGVEEETVAYLSLQQKTELTPRGVESAIPKLTVAPKPPKKRPYPSSFRSFCDVIPNSAISLDLAKVAHQKKG